MSTMRRFQRLLAIVPVTVVLLLCVGLLADSGKDEAASENAAADSSATVLLSDSTISLIDAEFRAIEPILRKSCYDCHSASTDYPWYHSLPGVGSFMDGHIKEGREHLDFTDGFPFGGEDDQIELLGDIRKEIEEGDMPLLSYRLLHRGTLIEGARRDSVFTWIDQAVNLLQSTVEPKH